MNSNIRTPAVIGALWPVCHSCRHIAQSHPANGEHICGEMTNSICPTCHNRCLMECQCRVYNGPTKAEFAVMIKATSEEIEYYNLK